MNKTKNLVVYAVFVALIAVGAFIKIPIGIVPMTLQVLFVTFAGLLLGKRGAIPVIVYIIIGLIGVPIFTAGGGIMYVLHPTFGYMIGFVVGSFVTGAIARSKTSGNSFLRYIIAASVGLVIIYSIGVPYVYIIINYYMGGTKAIGAIFVSSCLVFVPTDILSIVAASLLTKRIRPLLKY